MKAVKNYGAAWAKRFGGFGGVEEVKEGEWARYVKKIPLKLTGSWQELM